jgi:hypothetical protein
MLLLLPLSFALPPPRRDPAAAPSLSVVYSRLSFDVLAGSMGAASVSGFSALLRVGAARAAVARGSPASLASVRLSVRASALGGRASVLWFELRNSGAAAQTADISVTAALGRVRVSALPGGRGVAAAAVAFVLADYPLVSPVSSFWYGAAADAGAANWTQVRAGAVSSGDSALAFSWQRITVPPGGRAVRSCIVRSGDSLQTELRLSLADADAARSVAFSALFTVRGSVSAEHAVGVVLVVDDGFEAVFPLDVDFSEFPAWRSDLCASDLLMGVGGHRLSFYAVDAEGRVSAPAVLQVAVGALSSPTASVEVPIAVSSVAEEEHEEEEGASVMPIIAAVAGSGAVTIGIVAIFCYGRRLDREAQIESSSDDGATADSLLNE